jgi:hyperosmotically inducible periplasmic protein
MKYIRNLLILTIAILGFSTINGQANPSTDNRDVSQQTIERKVFKELIKLNYYGVFDNLKYKVDGNTVTLYGKVVQPITKKSAERVTRQIAGVGNVVNNIEVLPLSNFDDSIRLQTLRTLQSRGGSLYRYFLGTNPSVRIIVDRGHVELEGYVANRGDYNLMNILANGVSGVFSVQNNLVVEKEMVR